MGETNMIETMQSAAEQLSPVLWNAHWEALQDAERRMHGLAHEKVSDAASTRRTRVLA